MQRQWLRMNPLRAIFKPNISLKEIFSNFYALLKGSVGLRLKAHFLKKTVCLTPSSAPLGCVILKNSLMLSVLQQSHE